MISSFVTECSIQREDIFHGWFEGIVSYLRHSGVTEDGEKFMGTNELWSNFLARDTHVLQVR